MRIFFRCLHNNIQAPRRKYLLGTANFFLSHEQQGEQQQQLLLGELPAQLFERRIHMILDRTLRDAEPLADLAVRKVFEVAQSEYLAAFGRQRLDRRVETRAQVVGIELTDDRTVVGRIVGAACVTLLFNACGLNTQNPANV